MSNDYKPGSIVHVEIPAPDMKKARDFYSKVFGWDCTKMMGDSYCLFNAGELGGALDADGKPSKKKGSVLVLFAPDIPKKLKEIEKAGGETLKRKTEISGGHGFYGYFRDPNGNKMGLWTPAAGKQ